MRRCIVLVVGSVFVLGTVFSSQAISLSERMTLDRLQLQAPGTPDPEDPNNEDSPWYRHPDAPADSPACNNYHDSGVHNCRCPKAMRPDGTEAGHPDKSRGEDWCKDYCLTGRCECISMKKMPMNRK